MTLAPVTVDSRGMKSFCSVRTTRDRPEGISESEGGHGRLRCSRKGRAGWLEGNLKDIKEKTDINESCTKAWQQQWVSERRPEKKMEAPEESRENWISSLWLRKNRTGN